MTKQFLLLIIIGLMFCCPASGANHTYDIEDSEGIDLSGLVFCDERLYAIADNDDYSIFELQYRSSESAKLIKVKPIVPSSIPHPDYSYFNIIKLWLQGLTGKRYDWEGIACHNQQLVLLSESYSSLYNVNDNSWKQIDIAPIQKRGLMTKYGAYFEGVSITPLGIFLAVEREPRGIIYFDFNEVLRIEKSRMIYDSKGLPVDWSDITYWNNQLFGLYRNQNKVCRIDIIDLDAAECISFDEQLSQVKYDTSEPYGMAEGLAINNESIFIVLDNNRKKRINTIDDTRSILVVIKNTFSYRN